ncbi:HlyD family secretion protein, partial [Burkholderia thailandensis]
MIQVTRKQIVAAAAVVVAALGGYYGWTLLRHQGPGDGFASGNGRIEATEIDVATKLPGRIDAILVDEGDFVKAGQPLANMQIQVLRAQYDEASAQRQRALSTAAGVQSQVAQRKSDKAAAQAMVVLRESELDAAKRRLARSETLSREGASSMQELDDDRARARSAQAAVSAAA